MKKKKQHPIRPATLVEGSRYLLRRKSESRRGVSWEPVCFVSYTPCPAVVIVATRSGEKIRIAREELFLAKPSSPSLRVQPAAHSRPSPF